MSAHLTETTWGVHSVLYLSGVSSGASHGGVLEVSTQHLNEIGVLLSKTVVGPVMAETWNYLHTSMTPSGNPISTYPV